MHVFTVPLMVSFYITLAAILAFALVFLGHLLWCIWDSASLDETLDGRLLKWEITAEKVLMAMLAATFIMLCITFA
ncbi:MAG: hypothetical protein L0K77_10070 [Bifidobacterium crudilactis]|uniref:hypothetical protein n=2 Tax=Bifidobacterium crudilactis TaxID=327277 RepID=UPI0026470B29|nr:hypothetical protein [Bifidobacterium crudilactis]MDN6210320.1 hypothetical protein [Bifidobacterium crudilactis]MDN6233962.1 hypothetical protein [Bifidobacterium crudilactis]MDN6424627.1 hypothetical protein [Bifidobacterium crudilactis]MDN6459590.1 hypothetical protein [Bifidobacterium crudilactis]MDN6468290.1 hypothetical protein [Bifidobacterium crudilactis]